MLEAIIEKVQLRPEFLFGEAPGFVAIFANDDGDVQPTSHE